MNEVSFESRLFRTVAAVENELPGEPTASI